MPRGNKIKLHPNAIDISGQRSGRLTALYPTKGRSNDSILWLCQCKCENTTLVSAKNFRFGSVRSCGCLKRDRTSETRRLRLSGKRFGRLVAVRATEDRSDGKIVWECKCDCGQATRVRSTHLTSGATVSCGCYLSELAAKMQNEREHPFGKDHPNWKGGFCRKDYHDFTEAFKTEIRNRDHNTCQACGRTREEEGKELAVHHIDYDKTNSVPENCVTLCNSCHTKTNFNRKQWIKRFT